MARKKSSASGATPKGTGETRRCEVCGVSSHEKTLVGLRNDRRRNGPRFCLPHHPDSMAGSGFAGSASFVAAL
jgi:hypothetical protein